MSTRRRQWPCLDHPGRGAINCCGHRGELLVPGMNVAARHRWLKCTGRVPLMRGQAKMMISRPLCAGAHENRALAWHRGGDTFRATGARRRCAERRRVGGESPATRCVLRSRYEMPSRASTSARRRQQLVTRNLGIDLRVGFFGNQNRLARHGEIVIRGGTPAPLSPPKIKRDSRGAIARAWS